MTRTIALTRRTTVIGSDHECDLHLQDARVSRIHAVVVQDDLGYLILDWRSSNGMFVNGRQLSRHRLEPGDTISLGGVELRFVTEAPAEDPAPGHDAVETWSRVVGLLRLQIARNDLAARVLEELVRATGATRGALVRVPPESSLEGPLPGGHTLICRERRDGALVEPLDSALLRVIADRAWAEPEARFTSGADYLHYAGIAQTVLNVGSCISAPLVARGARVGLVLVSAGLIEPPLDAAHLGLIESVAAPLAMSLQ